MADNTVWLAIASVLATLNLGKARDKEGKEIDITGEYTNEFFRYVILRDISASVLTLFLSHPQPYQCSIYPRDSRSKELIEAMISFDNGLSQFI
jgi:hypothetical protein